MSSETKYFFVLSFQVNTGTGLAIVIAGDEREAFQHLKSSGKYNCDPSQYVLNQAANVGGYCGCATGLVLETYTNAMLAFEAFRSVMDKIVGPQGERGFKGEQGERGDTGFTPQLKVNYVRTVEPGEPADVEIGGTPENPTLGFTIPKGGKGDTGDQGQKGDKGDPGDIVEFSVGTVTELPIGDDPTVDIRQSQDLKTAQIDFGFPGYDITPESKQALKQELKEYVDGLMDGYEDTINGWIGEIERVVANALVRHEQALN